jgi:hypothetical protein
VGGCLDGLKGTTNVELLDPVAEVCNRGVSRIVSTEDVDGFLDAVRRIDVLNYEARLSKCSCLVRTFTHQ